MASIRIEGFHVLTYPLNITKVTNSNRMERQDGKHAWKKS